ncbi:hypothetical protein [Clostridium chauvoei]|uniref:Uncharacterized protein n=3 Tax=Clostridium chauvoei TaxID=46867 RepID=A0A1U6JHB2_9CLOT|nr:hypothetical protein [Clostridium chauvoei]MBX7280746.1 hypothetical protein [Clostridium chauvoei]MBX7283229.1 hypothetical protein [Clostridium chauvoei]MBX7285886.1 hypothetical protein [Clostridium chauvoei]MBX7288280.1 hypothetical protein [Clostridium chauvoei]MBX7290831.1 hypothetical protein [Clostridium chauvoei]
MNLNKSTVMEYIEEIVRLYFLGYSVEGALEKVMEIKRCKVCKEELSFIAPGNNDNKELVELYHCKYCDTLQEFNLNKNEFNVID